eukprot:12354368-Ditylum_brightwellii.AAC.1
MDSISSKIDDITTRLVVVEKKKPEQVKNLVYTAATPLMEERDSASIGSQEVTGFILHTTTSQTGVIVSEDWQAWLLVLQPL